MSDHSEPGRTPPQQKLLAQCRGVGSSLLRLARAPSLRTAESATSPDNLTTRQGEPRLRHLAEDELSGYLAELDAIAAHHRSRTPFNPEVLQLLLELDGKLWGSGMHHSVIVGGNSYYYPYDATFEGVLRPLRYALCYLSRAYHDPADAHLVLQVSAGYLEGCLKTLLTKRWMQDWGLENLFFGSYSVRKIGRQKHAVMEKFSALVSAPVHGEPDDRPAYQFEDALYAYFLARQFGLCVLSNSGKIWDIGRDTENAIGRQDYFYGAALPLRLS